MSTRITCLISGNGSNLQALIDNLHNSSTSGVEIVRVISNAKNAYGLQRAQKAGIPTHYFNLINNGYKKAKETDQDKIERARESYDADLASLVIQDSPHLVVCAGWMHILAPTFLDPLKAQGIPVINLHPALPGMYDGINAIGRAYTDFTNGTLQDNKTGIMIHYVISEVDRGTPITTRDIIIKQGETLEQLTARVHENEHELIVEGTKKAILELP